MTATPTALPAATILGYPRIGPDRELKRAEESFWAGRSDLESLQATGRALRAATRERLASLGLEGAGAVPESFSWYDQVLDAAVAVGALPSRFADLADSEGRIGPEAAFVLARGDAERPPFEMTKWFDTNYHYLVPEIGPDTAFRLSSDERATWVKEAADAGADVRPVIVGPVTLLLLAKAADDAPEGFDPISRLADLVPVYAEWISALHTAGASWVQIDEPALSADQRLDAAELSGLVATTYEELAAAEDRPQILVTTGYGHPEGQLPALLGSGIEALHLDLVRGRIPTAEELSGAGSVQLVAGVIDGRNIWRADLGTAGARIAELSARLEQAGGTGGVGVGTSTSLQHVPHDVERETKLAAELRETLAFADQKVQEVARLAAGDVPAGSVDGPLSVERTFEGVVDAAVRDRVASVTSADTDRAHHTVRQSAQQEALGLPELPTTTIGSFPQVGEVRKARASHRRGDLDDAGYEQAMKDEIARVIALQEDLGLDVLVHGEPERNDMVQYFAENLEGFATTEHGWVQSYGSRCTRPSILFGDVHRPAPITVGWSTYAQSLTPRPVKGMLTGPVTILAWSFVRDDQPLGDTAAQVGLALRDEVADLEAAGIRIVQVDEPALRELLPLRRAAHQDYLDWSVASFRLATSGVADATQIHTHLCYSEFNVVIDAIDALNADVTSIESARSRGEIVEALDPEVFPRGIGPGVWDIHSPRVPSTEEIAEQLTRARAAVGERLWVNPDCGLKTRGYAETEASLRHLVEATRQVRAAVPAV